MTRRCFLLLFALALTAFTGCQTGGDFPAPTAQWETFTGQMHYAGGSSSIVGDVVVRRSGPDFQMGFSSGPGFPLMRLSVSGSRHRAEGVLARKPWQGWLVLPQAFAAVSPGQPSAAAAGYGAEGKFTGGRLEHLVVSNAATGERFTFHFSR